jgi:hypothetical protein
VDFSIPAAPAPEPSEPIRRFGRVGPVDFTAGLDPVSTLMAEPPAPQKTIPIGYAPPVDFSAPAAPAAPAEPQLSVAPSTAAAAPPPSRTPATYTPPVDFSVGTGTASLSAQIAGAEPTTPSAELSGMADLSALSNLPIGEADPEQALVTGAAAKFGLPEPMFRTFYDVDRGRGVAWGSPDMAANQLKTLVDYAHQNNVHIRQVMNEYFTSNSAVPVAPWEAELYTEQIMKVSNGW